MSVSTPVTFFYLLWHFYFDGAAQQKISTLQAWKSNASEQRQAKQLNKSAAVCAPRICSRTLLGCFVLSSVPRALRDTAIHQLLLDAVACCSLCPLTCTLLMTSSHSQAVLPRDWFPGTSVAMVVSFCCCCTLPARRTDCGHESERITG